MLNLNLPNVSDRKQIPLVSGKFLFENILTQKQRTEADELFDSITMPPWTQYVSMHDIEVLYWAATAKSMAGNIDARRKIIRQVLEPRGFKRLTGGTNRDVFTHYEDQTIVAKVALDMVGLGDNQKEYDVQRVLFPWVTKMIQVCPSGVLGFAERVVPILSRREYNAHIPMVYLMLNELLGRYVMEDIGTEFFKNVGIRKGFGVVLLDYPYAYELDGNKLNCHNTLIDGTICGGEIDYDAGMNYLLCKRCGKRYYASDLQKYIDKEQISIDSIKGGKRPMLARLVKGNKVLSGSYDSDSIIRPNTAIARDDSQDRPSRVISANIVKGGKVLGGTDGPDYRNDTVSTTLTIPGIEETPSVEPQHKEPTIDYTTRESKDPKSATMMSFSQIEDKAKDPQEIIADAIRDYPDLGPAIKAFAKQIAESYLAEKRMEDESHEIHSAHKDNVEEMQPNQSEPTSHTDQDTGCVSTDHISEVVHDSQTPYSPAPTTDEFPPVQWANANGGRVVEPEEGRIKPYYIQPKEQNDDHVVIVASRRKGYYRKANNGFLGGEK